MIITTCYINNLEPYQLLHQNWGILYLYILISDAKLSTLIASHSVNVMLIGHKSCVFATTCDLLDGYAVHAKSRLWHVETSAAESFFGTFTVNLVTKP